MYTLLYEKKSSGDVGKIYAAKNFLNAINSPDSPMDEPDSVVDLMEKYTSALVLACYEKVKDKLPSEEPKLKHEKEAAKDRILDCIVDNFALPEMPDFKDVNKGLICSFCNKSYKRIAGLRKHLLEKHRDSQNSTEVQKSTHSCPYCPKTYKRTGSLKLHIKEKHKDKNVDEYCNEHQDDSSDTVDKQDHIYNYSCNALALGLLSLDFVDARKHGDGARVLRLYSFMLLFFKIAGNVKYAFYTLYTLSQIRFLLPEEISQEIIHERFVNSRGQIDSNYEIDRFNEHWNKIFKLDCRDLCGKVTQRSVDRASKSYELMDKLMKAHDKETMIHKPSGRHRKDEAAADVIELSKQYIERKIFDHVPGRKHRAFPGFKRNLLEELNVFDLKEWIDNTAKKFKKLNVFKGFANDH